jgi:MFS superfamily sulfate permease-like transporter
MFKTLRNDFPASIVVFFVALPLCLGIALASGAPLFSGLISGIVGGIVVGSLSGSKIGVSGPAAGLAAIVAAAIITLGSFENFLLAVVLGGVIQIIFGLFKLGIIGYFFPSSVIKGMLTGIGIFIILKEIPYFFGYEVPIDGGTTFSNILNSFANLSVGSTIIGVVSLGILVFWSQILSKKGKIFQLVQGPLVVVVLGIVFYYATSSSTSLALSKSQLVSVPVPDGVESFFAQFSFPNFGALLNPEVWVVAFTIALVASLETLLCVEATDKLDPHKNVTPTNRELLAQGVGNIVAGLIGGLPITQVIVRSSANIQSGGRTKISAILHGFLLLFAVMLIPVFLNKIPLAVLASILFVVGYKLAKPSLFKKMFSLGWKQWVPFLTTIVGIIAIDLLKGLALGLTVGIVVILIKSFQNSHFLHIQDKSNGVHKIKMTLAEEVTFFNKGAILNELDSIPMDTYLEIDVTKTQYLDNDIIEILDDFAVKAKERNIDIKLISQLGVIENPSSFVDFFKYRKKSA